MKKNLKNFTSLLIFFRKICKERPVALFLVNFNRIHCVYVEIFRSKRLFVLLFIRRDRVHVHLCDMYIFIVEYNLRLLDAGKS